jgi:hypothetical protein
VRWRKKKEERGASEEPKPLACTSFFFLGVGVNPAEKEKRVKAQALNLLDKSLFQWIVCVILS